MKVPNKLLKSIFIGVTVGLVASSCQKTDVNSGKELGVKPKKEKRKDDCPACGRG